MNNFYNSFTQLDFPNLGLIRLPEVKIDSKYKKELKLSDGCSNYEFLCALVKKGLTEKKHKLPKERLGEYFERADFELNIFEELGFTDYVLLVWLVVNKIRESGGFVDFGRGSNGASFVFALLGVTGILDVIDKGMIFERFVSKTRSRKQIINNEIFLDGSLIADCDINCGGTRSEIVKWLNEVYKGKMCKISALSTLTGKILIKDVYKTMNEVNETEAKRVADSVEKNFGIVEDIAKMPEKSEEFKEWSEKFPETFNVAKKLRNLIRQRTVHPSGYFISYYDLDGFVPLELNKDKELTLSFEMNTASQFGCKLDLLGLISNEILTNFFKQVSEKPEDIELDENPIVYNQFQNNDLLPYGLYQINAPCAYKVVNKIKPKNIFELSDTNGISRPGALDYLESYVNNNAECPHPIFEKIVKRSRNLFLYQEQLMQAIAAIGFTLDEAETCRKIIGKKLTDKVIEWEQKIYNKVKENNYPEEIGKILWKVLNDSAKYSFNISHSLTTSKLGALTVWAKYSYPLQFYKACLSATKSLPNSLEEISLINKELSKFNIQLLPPHILKSDFDFSIQGTSILMGLSHIKGVSDATLEKLDKFRHPYSNKFEIFEAAQKSKIPINILITFIMIGALDGCFTQSKSWVALEAAVWNILNDKEKIAALKLGADNNYDLIKIVKKLNAEIKDDKGKQFIKDSRFETIKKHYLPYKQIYLLNSKNEDFCSWIQMRKFIGFSHGKTLKDIFIQKRPGLINLQEFKDRPIRETVVFVGQIIEVKRGITKAKKADYIKFVVADEHDTCSCFIFNENIEECTELNGGKLPKEGDFVVVRGEKKGDDSVFARVVSVQTNLVVTKVSELKSKKNLDFDDSFDNISDIVFSPKKDAVEKFEENDDF